MILAVTMKHMRLLAGFAVTMLAPAAILGLACTNQGGGTTGGGAAASSAASGAGNQLVVVSPEPPGKNCSNGGEKIEVGVDANDDGVLEPNEVTSVAYVCNGAGHAFLVRIDPEPPGPN